MITLQSSLYNDYVATVGGVGELIDKVQKQDEEIKRLRRHCKLMEITRIENDEIEKGIMTLMMRQRIA
jgi:hypothetical protein